MTCPTVGETHVATLHLPVDIDEAWPILADPRAFPRLYPSRFAWVEQIGPAFHLGLGPAGDRFAIRSQCCRAAGVIAIDIMAPGRPVESRRSRLVPVPGGCLLLHVATRPDGTDDGGWTALRRAIDADLDHARHLLAQPHGEPTP